MNYTTATKQNDRVLPFCDAELSVCEMAIAELNVFCTYIERAHSCIDKVRKLSFGCF